MCKKLSLYIFIIGLQLLFSIHAKCQDPFTISSYFIGGTVGEVNSTEYKLQFAVGLPAGGEMSSDLYSVSGGLPVIPCLNPSVPLLATTETNICSGNNVTLNIASGNLNSASEWHWYTNSCGGISIGSGDSILVSPLNTTTYFARGEGGCIAGDSCASVTINVNFPQSLNLKFFIEGYYLGNGMMSPVLYTNGLSNDPTACDSIIVEFHDGNNPGTLISAVQGILHSDGTAEIIFPPAIVCGTYYISIRHRNSVETWSKFPLLINSSESGFDFTGQ